MTIRLRRLRSMIVLAVGVITGWCRRCIAAVELMREERTMRLTRPRTERWLQKRPRAPCVFHRYHSEGSR